MMIVEKMNEKLRKKSSQAHATDIKSCFVQSPCEDRSQGLATALCTCFFASDRVSYLRGKLFLLPGMQRVNQHEYEFFAQEEWLFRERMLGGSW